MKLQVAPRLGIIGGLGPETSCMFCLRINKRIIEKTKVQPDIVLENLPIPQKIEKVFINGTGGEDVYQVLLLRAVNHLNNAGVNIIVIPCNTVHIFIENLRKASKAPIISIMEECVKECERNGFKTIGVLGTIKTIQEDIHGKALRKAGLLVVVPTKKEQEIISKIVVRILHNTATKKDKKFLKTVIVSLHERGAEAIVLGCTDFSLLISDKDSGIPFIDTCKVLEQVVVEAMIFSK